MSRRSATFAILLPLALASGLAASLYLYRNFSISTARAELAEALGPCRLLEGRLTGGFAYAPLDPSHPGTSLTRNQRIALRKISQRISGHSPQAIADRAVLDLIDGKPRQAVEGLQRAVAALPTNAALLSDLSAVYLAEARANDDASARVKALEAAENALSIDPRLPEARFNRALALDHLFLRNQARSAWDDYRRFDPKSAWEREAQVRGRALLGPDAATRWAVQVKNLEEAVSRHDAAAVRQIVARSPQAAREYAEEKLFGDWARAELAHRSAEATRSLDTACAIGAALVAANGERMVADTVKAIEQAVSSHDSDRLNLLVDGHAVYQEGLGTYAEGRFAEAGEQFARARDALKQAGSPFAGWAAFRLAVAEMQSFHYDRSLALLDPLARLDFKSLAGRALWVEGLLTVIQGKPEESLADYRQAFESFSAIRERENAAVVNELVAECLIDLGDLTAAWRVLMGSLKSLEEMRDPSRRQQVLEQANTAALQGDQPSAALAFVQEAFSAASSPPTAASFYRLRWRALAHSRLKRFQEAEEDLREARLVVDRYPDESARKSLLGDLLATEGEIVSHRDPSDGLARLTSAIQIYENTSYSHQLAVLLAARARTYLAVEQTADAERDFERAITAIRTQRRRIADVTLRTFYLDEVRSIFDEMVALQARLGRKALALDYAEEARAQALRDLIAESRGEPPSIVLNSEAIQESLPDGVAIIEFSVLPRELLAWVIRRDSLDLFETAVQRHEVQALVANFQATGMSGRANKASRDLAELLLGKLMPGLQGARELVIVPDRSLHAVPFAALPALSAQRYLVEQYAIAVAPSANLVAEPVEEGRRLRFSSASRALVVGNPAFDHSLLPDLVSLPHAEGEGSKISSFYRGSRLVSGKEATPAIFLEGLKSFDVVHFAGHAVANSASPLASFLALAPAGKASGVLYARDLYRLRGARAGIVVLSACSSLSGTIGDSEGMMSLARSFLAAGVPAVVGSLWRVDDRASQAFFLEFHHHLQQGGEVAEALRETQVAFLSSKDSAISGPSSWGGVQLFTAGIGSDKYRRKNG
jgi:CHAT domain-containing protein